MISFCFPNELEGAKRCGRALQALRRGEEQLWFFGVGAEPAGRGGGGPAPGGDALAAVLPRLVARARQLRPRAWPWPSALVRVASRLGHAAKQ